MATGDSSSLTPRFAAFSGFLKGNDQRFTMSSKKKLGIQTHVTLDSQAKFNATSCKKN